ncbi:WecB/TagA/CpsF family glycosyltransferase [Treponema sp.]|uniref:WecB/TagA/CpsF family glycosyltransferase n=1 Tax=Treponema sp. TaxID=166 RepID=UPI003F1077A0
MAVQRIDLLGVPVDVCSSQDLEEKVLELLEKGAPSQISFITIWDFIRARGKNEYAESIRNADLVIPVSKSILFGAKFLCKTVPFRHNPFDVFISVLSILESRYKSFYMFGGKKKALTDAEKNMRATFRGLQIVGRCVGYYQKSEEENIVQAISKASPSLVLVSEGIKKRDYWSYSRRNRFSTGIFMYYRDAVGILSKRIKRVNPKVFERGYEIWGELLRNPLKFFLIFPFMWYIILLVWTKLFKKD